LAVGLNRDVSQIPGEGIKSSAKWKGALGS